MSRTWQPRLSRGPQARPEGSSPTSSRAESKRSARPAAGPAEMTENALERRTRTSAAPVGWRVATSPPSSIAPRLHAEGLSTEAFEGRPLVGICNLWSELVNCNLHSSGACKLDEGGRPAGRRSAPGVPDDLAQRESDEADDDALPQLTAMDVEESIRSHPLDSVVLLGGCDKTVPAQLMGAVSADVPAIRRLEPLRLLPPWSRASA
jgi:dihydroxyacid dehydratase/phosphogluconate dehydratase